MVIVMLIISGILYLIVGILITTDIILSSKRYSSEEENMHINDILEKNSKKIGPLLIIGAILGIGISVTNNISWQTGLTILIVGFVSGIVIRIVMQIKQR